MAGFLGMSSFRQGNQAPLPSPMTTENVTNRTVKATLKTVRKNGAGAGTRRPIVALSGHLDVDQCVGSLVLYQV